MQIYVMRHGQAELIAPSDCERPLSPAGCLESEKMATYLAANNVSFDVVLVSPYLRAQQTLRSVQPLIAQDADVQVLELLTPAGNARKIVNEIIALQVAGVKNLLIISHLPLVGYIVRELVPEAGAPAFATSSVAHVELDESGFATLHGLTSVAQLNSQSATPNTQNCQY